MRVLILEVVIDLPWSHSLKEKRQEKRKIMDRMKNRWNISMIETKYQDVHQSLCLGISCVSLGEKEALEKREQLQRYLEDVTDGEVRISSWDIL